MGVREVIRIERWTNDEGVPMERISKERCHCNGPDIGNQSLLDGDARVEWDRCVQVAEECGLSHLIDPIWLRDHCLNVAGGSPVDPLGHLRRAYWDIRSVPIHYGASCGGGADETYVPA
jgi:hypothetical protein